MKKRISQRSCPGWNVSSNALSNWPEIWTTSKPKSPVRVYRNSPSSDAVFPSFYKWQIASSNSRRRRVQKFSSVISNSNISAHRHRSEFSFRACVQLGVGYWPFKFHENPSTRSRDIAWGFLPYRNLQICLTLVT